MRRKRKKNGTRNRERKENNKKIFERYGHAPNYTLPKEKKKLKLANCTRSCRQSLCTRRLLRVRVSTACACQQFSLLSPYSRLKNTHEQHPYIHKRVSTQVNNGVLRLSELSYRQGHALQPRSHLLRTFTSMCYHRGSITWWHIILKHIHPTLISNDSSCTPVILSFLSIQLEIKPQKSRSHLECSSRLH